MLFFAKKTLEN